MSNHYPHRLAHRLQIGTQYASFLSNVRKPNSSAKSVPVLQPRLRIVHGADIALGPGKAELLELIGRTGSIRQAAMQMGMSYMRAWTLVKTMERCYRDPIVSPLRGGAKGGGAELTANGKAVLALYQKMEADALKATAPSWRKIQALLAAPTPGRKA